MHLSKLGSLLLFNALTDVGYRPIGQIVQGANGLHQPIDGGLRLVPDVGGWGHRVLQHAFVLLQLRPVLLDLLLDQRNPLNRVDSGLRQVGAV